MDTLLIAASLLMPTSQVSPRATVGVPFGCGHAYVVSQAHQTGSHLQNDTWAWDFRMPSGTPVVAALDGEVRMSRGDSVLGGCDPKLARHANYVVLRHAGGLETQYLHFSEVVVKPGDKVRRGQLLGYSGETGWACGAHLHFKLAQSVGTGWNNPSLPAWIDGYGDPVPHVLVRAPACADGAVQMASHTPSENPVRPKEALGLGGPQPGAPQTGQVLPARGEVPPPRDSPPPPQEAAPAAGPSVPPTPLPGPAVPLAPAPQAAQHEDGFSLRSAARVLAVAGGR